MCKRHLLPALLISLMAGNPASAQETPGLKPRPPESAGLSRYANRLAGTVRLRLEKRLEMKKLKIGDPVQAKLQQDMKIEGETVVAKNSRFVGHVAELMFEERSDPATRLGILFDRAELKGGGELALYGAIVGVIVPQDNAGENPAAALQATRLQRMAIESRMGEMTPETEQTIRELSVTAITGQPTFAARQWNCQQTSTGDLWCAPPGHTLAGRPMAVPGLPGVIFQLENTQRGPMGVLVSGKHPINLNAGIDFQVRLMPQP